MVTAREIYLDAKARLGPVKVRVLRIGHAMRLPFTGGLRGVFGVMRGGLDLEIILVPLKVSRHPAIRATYLLVLLRLQPLPLCSLSICDNRTGARPRRQRFNKDGEVEREGGSQGISKALKDSSSPSWVSDIWPLQCGSPCNSCASLLLATRLACFASF